MQRVRFAINFAILANTSIIMTSNVAITDVSSSTQVIESPIRLIPQVSQAKLLACRINSPPINNFRHRPLDRTAQLIPQHGKDQNARKESAIRIIK